MIDAILYVPDYPDLVDYLNLHHRDLLERDEYGALAQPPVVTGFARTPAVVCSDGIKVMVYARMRVDEADRWENIPGYEVLASAPYTGRKTPDVVYAALFADSEAKAKYDSVYDSTPYEVDDGEGGTVTVTPPERFGVMA